MSTVHGKWSYCMFCEWIWWWRVIRNFTCRDWKINVVFVVVFVVTAAAAAAAILLLFCCCCSAAASVELSIVNGAALRLRRKDWILPALIEGKESIVIIDDLAYCVRRKKRSATHYLLLCFMLLYRYVVSDPALRHSSRWMRCDEMRWDEMRCALLYLFTFIALGVQIVDTTWSLKRLRCIQ